MSYNTPKYAGGNRVLPDTVHHETYNYIFKEFQNWYNSEANPAYQKLLNLEKEVDRLKQTINSLTGASVTQAGRGNQAIRFVDLSSLPKVGMTTAPNLAASGEVTVEKFNKLLAEVKELKAMLGPLSSLIAVRNGR